MSIELARLARVDLGANGAAASPSSTAMPAVSWLMRSTTYCVIAWLPPWLLSSRKRLKPWRIRLCTAWKCTELNGFGRQGDGPGKRHVIRRVAWEQNRRDQHVGFLRDQLGALQSVEEVRTDRALVPVFLREATGMITMSLRVSRSRTSGQVMCGR